jgi:dTDP-4-dehydrorhamnose reductase
MIVQKAHKIEIWGGMECTINRISDRYLDQLDYSGHYHRSKDLDLFSELGISKIRYPILWEKYQPAKGKKINWSTVESKLLQLKQSEIQVIAGLVHHGSGPAYVDLRMNSFPDGLETYARLVAEKFPWIEYYTPINEPLTTARFCGLYGLWHPHERSDKSFLTILLNECKATVLAMQAIRKINPNAQLIQTEDLGKTHSTPLLQYQADFENERRWLAFDLLCGMVTPQHPLWNYMTAHGIRNKDLSFFLDNPCVPSIMGLNHYLTSERYLDENTSHYPPHTHGGNFYHRYADVEAVRNGNAVMSGCQHLLKEAWERYKLPIAVTEVHLHCTREEQLRWFHKIWKTAHELKQNKVDIKAVTSWALLGSFGWNKLLTEEKGQYESGVFDLSSGAPRPTALKKMIQCLSSGKPYHHPVISEAGWWEREGRIIYNKNTFRQHNAASKFSSSPILIIGKTGTLGNAIARMCTFRHLHYQLLDRKELDICDLAQIERNILERKPWAIINAAGYVNVDRAETEKDKCFLINTDGPRNLALMCEKYGVKLMTFSSDLVFDGRTKVHYFEDDITGPLNVYGESKAMAEHYVTEACPSSLIIRTSAFFGPWDKYNFAYSVMDSLRKNLHYLADDDLFISPTYVPDLANACLDLLIDDEKGIWHLANAGSVSWADLAREIAARSRHKQNLIIPRSSIDMNYKAMRPKYSVLKSGKGELLPSLENAIDRFVSEVC